MVVISGLESSKVIMISSVKAKGITVVKECVARAVISIIAMLVDMGMGITVENGNCHPVDSSNVKACRKCRCSSHFIIANSASRL